MFISLKESRANGFNKWSALHQPKSSGRRDANEENGVVMQGPDFGPVEPSSPEPPQPPCPTAEGGR